MVAENDDGKLVGQVVLYRTDIITPEKKITELVLSPICVHPDYFCRGVGRAMMEKSFDIAKFLGYTCVFLCGDPNFYRRIGFKPTYEYNIFHVDDNDKNAQWCMVRELVSGALANLNGTVDIE